MRYSTKYFSLIDIFLQKRQDIDGFYTDFTFTWDDLRNTSITDEAELAKMLDTMVRDITNPDPSRQPSWKKNRSSFTVTNCSTDGLTAFKGLIRRKLKKSLLSLEQHDDDKYYIHYRGEPGYIQNPIKGTHQVIMQALIEDLHELVTFNKALSLLQRKRLGKAGRKPNNKTVQNIINKLVKHLNHEFPDLPSNAIQPVRGKGYKLTT